ncbi:MAG TPA: adenylate/guanylate cyclase domain-containing protein, partial [Leptospiraceae bacterium]|nr:adenylate/guanylate cyclase domain-containing protein [Leptospiraceae bacterium]
MLTFTVGLSLSVIGLLSLRRNENRPLLVTFSLFCFGIGILGLLLAFRAIVLNLDILLLLNRALYFGVVCLSPGAYMFAYFLTAKRYKPLLVMGIFAAASAVFGWFGLITGYDFTGSWFHYSFGNYPIAQLPLKLWGLIAALGYFVAWIPATVRYFRTHPQEAATKKALFFSMHMISLLVISNLPSLAGIPVFPMSTFAFLPMLVLGYSIFRGDFLNVNDLLFRKRLLFKFLAGLLTFGFIGISVLVAVTLPPATHSAIYERPFFLLPLFSAVCAFALAIFLAGSNPDQKLNMLAAASLMLAGTFMLVMTSFKLNLPLIVTRRIEQILYTAFLFTPGVHLRFVYLALGRKSPRAVRLVDLVSALLCVVLWTPYFFDGFHEYSFGRISAGGPGLNAYGALGLFAAGAFLFSWWKVRKEAQSKLGSLVVLSLVIGDVLILFNLPATMGIAIYPVGELQFIPAFLLAFVIVHYGVIPVIGEATAIGNRVSLLILLFVPISILFYALGLRETASVTAILSHTIFVASPLALAFYMISFIFLRPTALKMDETVRRLAEEKDRADAALHATEEARREIEALSRFTHIVNSHSDLEKIFKEISQYVYQNFGISGSWLFLPDEKGEHLTSFRAYSYHEIRDDLYEFAKNLRIPLDSSGGIAHVVWNRRKPLYLPQIRRFEFDFDRRLVENTGAQSFLHVPLVLNDRSVAMVIFTNVHEPMRLSKKDIRTIETFCAQIAGVVNTVHLLRQTEKQKADMAALNRLTKSLNEDLDIETITRKLHEYVKENFGIQYYSLLCVDAAKTHLRLVAAALPDFVSAEDRDRIFHFHVPMKGARGGHGLTLRSKRPIYFKDFGEKDLRWLTDEERYVLDTCRIKSYLFLPLLLNGEPVGMLNFSNSDGPLNLKDEDLTRFSILGEQMAGIITGSALFKEVQAARNSAESERKKSEKLLLNILPADVASELKEKGATDPVLYENVSVMFTDFKGFTQIAETLSPRELIQDLDACFVQFDKVTERFNLEKLKTIGDSYMCAGGIPRRNKTHAIDCVLAALEIQAFMNLMKQIKTEQGLPYWELRLGIHSGPLVAGVIGEKKFAYDVWGDTVNTASRMESSGTPGRINISGSTFELVKDVFDCEFRGYVSAKNKGEVAMYYVNKLKEEYS